MSSTTRIARIAALFAFGAAWLSFCDGFHTHSGTTEYREELFLRAAWWTPLLFASAAGFGGVAYATSHQRLAPTHPVPPWHRIALGLVVYTACYAATAWVRVPLPLPAARCGGSADVVVRPLSALERGDRSARASAAGRSR